MAGGGPESFKALDSPLPAVRLSDFWSAFNPIHDQFLQVTEFDWSFKMSDHSPTKEMESKETAHVYTPDEDVEQGDPGIINHASPLARKLKGRHMQMIAIGTYSSLTRQRRFSC
jgi:hypothetical protein